MFINTHLNDSIPSLLFKKTTFTNTTLQAVVSQIAAKKKCEKKLPSWYTTKNIFYPNKLNIEQTSSEKTAKYKAKLVKGKSIIDLTGGFGVDCYYFAKQFEQVTHCEINTELSKIVTHNYQALNATNIKTVATNGIDYLKSNIEVFDWIYIDPSRRDDIKGKVFLLNDCLPNITEHLGLLFEKANNILIKTSPLLDIKKTISDLKFVKSVHIVALKNEVKELLFILEKKYNSTTIIYTVNIINNKKELFNFTPNTTNIASYSLPQKYIYEPNSAILKSGAFHEIATTFKLNKLHQHSHLYTNNTVIDFPGRLFKVLEVLPYQKKDLKKRFSKKQYNITTRNFPKSVSEIRNDLNIKVCVNQYLFFTTNLNNYKIIIICEK